MTAEKTDITVEDCMSAAWAAIRRGDYAERDRLLALVERAARGRDSVPGNESVICLPDRSLQ